MQKVNDLINDYSTFYKIMSTIEASKLPVVFKGALVLRQAIKNSIYSRQTKDIDCDWIGSPPTPEKIEELLNNCFTGTVPSISFKLSRPYVIGRQSAGFNIYADNSLLTTMDMSIKPVTSNCMYYVGESSFPGYTLSNILSDKIYVLSTDKKFRRIKDLIDIYCIISSHSIDTSTIFMELESKQRELADFNAFLNRKDEIEHAYNRFKGMDNKPDFKEIYQTVFEFIQVFLPNK
ncbi:MAG: nucleotidyl transferase AbiEii/AbiGii toxin family protein [Erysipelotrichaceae bacterium]|nr:nucleotidyl transferase AbiEii/AbiGii toxin family protein [Erysipelotrichaceae bacterium]